MKIPKTIFLFSLLVLIFQVHAADNCFQPTSQPVLANMWASAQGYRLAAGQTHMDFGEARFYHDGDRIYVYIRNDQFYATGANVKFDISDNLADLKSKSNQLNKQKIPVSSSIVPGTQLWFESSFSCWGLTNPEEDNCAEIDLFFSIHIDAATQTVWVGQVNQANLKADTCFGAREYPGQNPWFCYSKFSTSCFTPPGQPGPQPVCLHAFGIPLSFVNTERFSFFTEQYWGGNFLIEPENSVSLDIIAGAEKNNLLGGQKVGIAIISLSSDYSLSFTFQLNGFCYVASELQIDLRTTSRRIRGVPDRYTFQKKYPDSTETLNGQEVIGVESDSIEENVACLLPVCHEGPYWVTVHMHVCPFECQA